MKANVAENAKSALLTDRMRDFSADRETSGLLTDWEWEVSDPGIPPQGGPRPTEFRIPFDRGDLILAFDRNPPAWAEPMMKSAARLLALPSNWDSYGASRINPQCIRAALELARRFFCDETPPPSVVPTCSGGVQLEWHKGGIDLEIEFLSPTHLGVLFEDCTDGTSWEKELTQPTADLGPVEEALTRLSRRCDERRV